MQIIARLICRLRGHTWRRGKLFSKCARCGELRAVKTRGKRGVPTEIAEAQDNPNATRYEGKI